MTEYVLGWCDLRSAHFWGLELPAHRCPHKLGSVVCVCPCHSGVSPDEVNARLVEAAEREEATRQKTVEALKQQAEPKVAPKKKRVRRLSTTSKPTKKRVVRRKSSP